MAISRGLFTSDKDYWETPASLFEELDEEFHFTLDPCSTDANAKCGKHYTAEDDGLSKSWGGERVFCNPPYGHEIAKWVRKAHDSVKEDGTIVVMLLPARTDTRWFHDYIANRSEVRLLRGRIKFEIGGVPMQSAPFPSMVVVFRAACV